MSKLFKLTVNSRSVEVSCQANAPLLYVLRNDLTLNGPKFGCGLGQCGACTVLINGEPIRSCIMTVSEVGKVAIVTLEGLASGGKPHPLQAAFNDVQAAQCGFCSNGMIMTAKALLDTNRNPDDAAIRKALSANLCRCGIHNRIVRAVRIAAQEMAR